MKCPRCGSEFESNFCPKCGYSTVQQQKSQEGAYSSTGPTPRKKGGCLKIILIVIGIIVVIGIIGALFGGGDDKKVKDATATSSDKASSESSAEDAASEKLEFVVGEVAEYNNIQMSVLSYEESAGNEWGSPAEGNVFVFANIEITNNSNAEIGVSSMASFDAYCDDYKLDYSSNSLMAASTDNRQQMDGSIAAGKKLNGWLGFEVPSGWNTIEINYKDNIFLDSNFKFIINK